MATDWQTLNDGQDQYGLIEHGGDHAVLLQAQVAALQSLGLRAPFHHFDVPVEEFEACIQRLSEIGIAGLAVANPHKVNAARLGTKFFVARQSMGVANALQFNKSGIYANNTETDAFGATVRDIEPDKVLVLGSGQAARSVVSSLLGLGWKVKIWNRNVNKSRLFQTTFSRYGAVELSHQPDPSGCKMIVNATPVGTKAGEKPPLIIQYVRPKTIFYDLVYRRVATEFLRDAALRGCPTIDGRELLVEQTAQCFEWWTEKSPDREAMRQAVGLRARAGLA